MNPLVAGLSLTLIFAALAVASRWWRPLSGLAFTFAVLAVVAGAGAFPALFIEWGGFELKSAIAPLVQVILFGMGLTLTFSDFRRILAMPRAILIGVGLQFLIMPFSGALFARAFGLEAAVAAGLILVGSCPGGTASNVIAYLARANVPLSVTMTVCSTLLSPLLTPLAMKWLAGAQVPIDAVAMMLSIVKMVIVPLVMGLLVHRYLPKLAAPLAKVLPFLAMIAICLIIGVTVALSRDQLLVMGLFLFGAAACHNATGLGLGYGLARVLGMDRTDARTVAIEVGMQNGGMATGLAFNVLNSPLAATASAVFGPWSAVTASVLASFWSRNTIENPS